MPSFETEFKLAELLSSLAENERKVETNRVILAEHQSFEPYSCFKLLDKLGLGYVTLQDIKDFYISRGIYCSDYEAAAFIKQFDADRDNRLNIDEFCHICLPACDRELREAANSRTAPMNVPYEVEYRLLRLFERELMLQKKLETHKRSLGARHDFAGLELFKALDVSQLNSLDAYNLQTFLRKHGFTVLQDDLDAIMRRMDTDGDGSLSYVEFVEGIMPVEPVYKVQEKQENEESRYKSSLRQHSDSDTYSASLRIPDDMSRTSLRSPSERGRASSKPQSDMSRASLKSPSDRDRASPKPVNDMSRASLKSPSDQDRASPKPGTDMSRASLKSPRVPSPVGNDFLTNYNEPGDSLHRRSLKTSMSQSGFGSDMKARDSSYDRDRSYEQGRGKSPVQNVNNTLNRAAMSLTGFGTSAKSRLEIPIREPSYERERARGMSPNPNIVTFDKSAMSRTGFSSKDKVESGYGREYNVNRISSPKAMMSITGFGASPTRIESPYSRESILSRGRVTSPKVEIERQFDRAAMTMTGFGVGSKIRLDKENSKNRERVPSPKPDIDRYSDRYERISSPKPEIERYSDRFERVSSPKPDIERYSDRLERISSPKPDIERYSDKAGRISSPKPDIQRSLNGYQKYASGRISSPKPDIDSSLEKHARTYNSKADIDRSSDTSGRTSSSKAEINRSLENHTRTSNLKAEIDRSLEKHARTSNPKVEVDRSLEKHARNSDPKAEVDRSSERGVMSATGRISSPKPNINSRLDLTSTSSHKPIPHAQSFTESYSSPHRSNLRSPSSKPGGATPPLKSSLRNTSTGPDDFSSSYRRSFAESVRFSPTLEISAPHEYSAKPPPSRPRLSLNQESSSLPESELANIFRHQINHFRDLEDAKVALSSRPDFNTFDGYRLLDPQDKNYISALDLEDRLKELGVTCIQDEHILLMKHYSSHKDLRLRYYDFCDMVNPKNEQYAKMLASRNSSGAASVFDVFTKETLDKIANTFRLFLEAEIVSERLRQKLENSKEFSLYDAFKAVDKDKNGFITLDEFETILTDHGVAVTHQDLLSLMERYDKNRDGRVSYSEFVQEITPKSPKRY